MNDPTMIGYASRTGTKRNLAVLERAGWRLMVSAKGVLRTEGFRYALDNGAWTSYASGKAFDVPAFETAVEKLGAGADFVVLPDIVCGGLRSLALSVSWLRTLESLGPLLLIPAQNGMEPRDLLPYVASGAVGVFLGGDDKYKDSMMAEWGRFASTVGCYFHVGRVNTRRRIKASSLAGAHSFDGSSVSRFSINITHLDAERRQGVLCL